MTEYFRPDLFLLAMIRLIIGRIENQKNVVINLFNFDS